MRDGTTSATATAKIVGARQLIVMGVSGCGKSTVGAALAQALGVAFVEGDALHPPANVQRMAAGTPLTDADRAGWLQLLAQCLRDAVQADRGQVLSCSALKRSYRDVLRAGAPDAVFVHLHGSTALLQERVQARQHPYMPASLLQSQLDTLEPPAADEAAIACDIAWPTEAVLAHVQQRLAARVPA